MESGTVRLRSVSALSHALARPRARGEERTTEAVTSTVKEARPLEGSPSKASRKLQKREEPQSQASAGDAPTAAPAECMTEIRQILAQRESSRCLTFGCSPPMRCGNPLASTFIRCTPNVPQRCVGFQTGSCISPPAHA